MVKKNGWLGRAKIIALTIVAFGGAFAVFESLAARYAPWAPKELVHANFVMAAENTLDRHHSLIIKLTFLIEQAKNSGDATSQAAWQKQLLGVKQKIKELEADKVRRK